MYDLQRLRTLRELKHRGTLAEVARALAYTPSAISQQLAHLEAEVGVPLLEPVGRRVRLTPQAEILVAHTEIVLRELELAEAHVAASLTRLEGALHVAAFQSAVLTIVPDAMLIMHRDHPELHVHVTQMEPEHALPGLLARDFDIVVGQEYPGVPGRRPAGVHVVDLLDDPLHLAVPAEARRSSDNVLSDLAHLPWAMESAGTAARRSAFIMCRAAGFEPDVRFESSDVLVHLRLVEMGLAVAIVPGLVGRERMRAVALHPPPTGPCSRRVFTAVRDGREHHPAIREFRAALRHVSGEEPRVGSS